MKMLKKVKKIPTFKNEDEEFEFWSKHEATEYFDWSNAKRMIFPNLKPTSRAVSIKFPISLLERLKFIAHKNTIPYQTLIKLYVKEGTEKELEALRKV